MRKEEQKIFFFMTLLVGFLMAIGYDQLRCMLGLAKCLCIINDDGYNLTWVLHLIGGYFLGLIVLFTVFILEYIIHGKNNEQDNISDTGHDLFDCILIQIASALLWSFGFFFLLNCRLI